MKIIKIIKRRYVHSQKGFTLLEVMVAVSIIAIVFTAVFKMHSQTISMQSASIFYTTAPLLAQKKIAEIKITPIDELMDGSGDFGDDFPGYNWKVSIEDVESEILGNTAKDLKKIDIIISLDNDQDAYSIRTYKFFR